MFSCETVPNRQCDWIVGHFLRFIEQCDFLFIDETYYQYPWSYFQHILLREIIFTPLRKCVVTNLSFNDLNILKGTVWRIENEGLLLGPTKCKVCDIRPQ